MNTRHMSKEGLAYNDLWDLFKMVSEIYKDGG